MKTLHEKLNKQASFNDKEHSGDIPVTTFPSKNSKRKDSKALEQFLFNSDSEECNSNLSKYIKEAIGISRNSESKTLFDLEALTRFTLKLLSLNMFIRNYRLCIAKLLAMLSTLSEVKESTLIRDNNVDDLEIDLVLVFCALILLILLKVKNLPSMSSELAEKLNLINKQDLYSTLKELDFIVIISNFISCYLEVSLHDKSNTESHYHPIKLGCDLIFEYLYECAILEDIEIKAISNRSKLIPLLIKSILSVDNFEHNDSEENWEDESQMITYEEFKLLLLINEQYLMKHYTDKHTENRVFSELIENNLAESSNSVKLEAFLSLVVFYLNREDSQIVKILILKFLYLIFTTSYTAKIFYLNDLKILVDIFLRELNDLDFNSTGNQNNALMITYLKVLYPLLKYSQLSELPQVYKGDIIVDILRSLVINTEIVSSAAIPSMKSDSDNLVSKLAMRCMSLSSLKRSHRLKKKESNSAEGSSGELSKKSSYSSLNSKLSGLLCELYNSSNTSAESIEVFQRVPSVKTTSRTDYHRRTITHNSEIANGLAGSPGSIYEQNNHNVFRRIHISRPKILRDNSTQHKPSVHIAPDLLDMPKEVFEDREMHEGSDLSPGKSNFMHATTYLKDSIVPMPANALKAIRKKAPPPPPPPRRKHM